MIDPDTGYDDAADQITRELEALDQQRYKDAIFAVQQLYDEIGLTELLTLVAWVAREADMLDHASRCEAAMKEPV